MKRRPDTGSETRARAFKPAPRDEVALIGQVARGDTVAFEALFRRYAPRLTRFLARTTRRPHLIDEILNDTMMVVWRKAGTFDRTSKVSTWIVGIALRRRLKALERADDAIGSDPDEIPTAAESGPESQLLRQELQARLSRALRSLSPEHRMVVELTYFEGCTYREIAAIAGCPVDTVKTRMFHARRRLKQLLADAGERAA
jgi:RNA polymerase sigma-70 factor (ECF subfamily)